MSWSRLHEFPITPREGKPRQAACPRILLVNCKLTIAIENLEHEALPHLRRTPRVTSNLRTSPLPKAV